MHTGTVHLRFRLRHKGSMQPMPFCNGFHRKLKGHNIIRSRQRFIIFKINFMLCRGRLMMGGFHNKPHILKRQHHIPSRIFPPIHRPQIKIPRLFMGNRRRHGIFIHMEQKKFTLRPRIKRISHFLRFLQRRLQNISGIPLKRLISRPVHITNQPRHLPLLRPPRKNLKRIQIRMQK